MPVYHLDALYWKPGWVETESSHWAELQESICRQSSWIIDGNYGGTMDIRLAASDTIVFLDINRYVCLWNAFRRTIKYFGKTRPDMGQGCKERFELKFMHWIYGYPVKRRPEILDKLSKLEGGVELFVLKNRQDIHDFLEHVSGSENRQHQ